ncbi:ABC transporter ATP-binding protein [Saccharibacillus sp. CPCC 101409]|uniref:ABC transporter ATP-binding protein n=1 Tax=Saccharibacillus sp. CPCC 101409 TaxID=3058041 RepID=UPI002670D2EF|nr:ABC transporter ATP-binding protein [Saccharibacillus sp. CPCC 101409]MDO3408879.1 ABC transporter ATP-binding protein [Saccharibacillus sp. CPCC 101409]
MEQLLEFQSVSKSYGKRTALRDVTLSIGPGRIVGLLGSNGSGKTTLMRIASGLTRPDSGTVRASGHEPGPVSKASVSFMPDKPVFESWMTVGDTLDFQRDFFADYDPGKASRMLDFMKLSRKDKASSLSKGMQERLQITLALSRRASLYLLDEPIGGVDPVSREHILNALMDFYEEDSTIVVSTHLVADMERIFDTVVMLKGGGVVLHEEVEQIRIDSGKSIDQLFKEVYAEC